MPIRFSQFSQYRRFALVLLIVALVLTVALISMNTQPQIAYAQVTVTPSTTPSPTATNTLTPTPLATGLANPSGNGLQYLICGRYSFGDVTPGACLQIYNGSDVEVFSSTGERTFYVDGETGNVTVGGVVSASTSRTCGILPAVVGTAIAPHAAIPTPGVVNVTLAQDATGDGEHVSYTNAGGVVTVKVWNSALTPAPNTTPAAVAYCIESASAP